MNIAFCLKDADTRFLECGSAEHHKSRCTCYKRGYGIFKFESLNSDIYKNLNINEINNINVTDKWYASQGQRINDCLQSDESTEWTCYTSEIDFNITLCECFSGKKSNYIASGDILTKSLYNGIDDITFAEYHELDEDMNTHQREMLAYENNSIHSNANSPNVDLNIFHKNENDLLTQNQNFSSSEFTDILTENNLLLHENDLSPNKIDSNMNQVNYHSIYNTCLNENWMSIFTDVIVFIFILFLILIGFIYKRIMHYKYKARGYDGVLLIVIED